MILNFESKIKRNNLVFDTEKDFEFSVKKDFEGLLRIQNFAFENIGYVRFHAYNLDLLNFKYMAEDFSSSNFEELKKVMKKNAEAYIYYQIFEKGFDIEDKVKVKDNILTNLGTKNENGNLCDLKGLKYKELYGNHYLITLDRIYIDTRFRNKGIATYIYKNLFKLLYVYFDILPVYAVGVVIPNMPELDGSIHKGILEKENYKFVDLYDMTGFCKNIFEVDVVKDLVDFR